MSEAVQKPPEYWTGEEGLESSKEWALDFYKKEGKSPTYRDMPKGVTHAIENGEYHDHDINSFNDFLRYCDLEVNEEKSGDWTRKEGLERAKERALNFYEEKKRSPTSREVPRGITGAIRRGEYEDWGIQSFNDFLRYCDLEVNQREGRRWGDMTQEEIIEYGKEQGYVGMSLKELAEEDPGYYDQLRKQDLVDEICEREIKPWGHWTGEEGFERAKEWVEKYHKEERESPGRRDLPGGVQSALDRNEYEDFGVETFTDLLGECDLSSRRINKYSTGDGEGFERAKEYVEKYHKEEGEPPRWEDLPPGILGAFRWRKYKDFGVKNYSDLLEECGIEPRLRPNHWTGEEGLLEAKKDVSRFIDEEGRLPINKDLEDVSGAVGRGNFKEFNINTFSDLRAVVLPEHLPLLFQGGEIKKYHSRWRRLLGKMEDRELIHEVEEGIYTTDRELAEILSSSEKKEEAEKGEGTYHPPSKIKTFTKEAESEIELIERWEI